MILLGTIHQCTIEDPKIDLKSKCEWNMCLSYVLALQCTGNSINIPEILWYQDKNTK